MSAGADGVDSESNGNSYTILKQYMLISNLWICCQSIHIVMCVSGNGQKLLNGGGGAGGAEGGGDSHIGEL